MNLRLLVLFYIILVMIGVLVDLVMSACFRLPQGATGDRSPVDDKFHILIDNNPTSYLPGQEYNISLSCSRDYKFISFTLVVEEENGHNEDYDRTGRFHILDHVDSRFSTLCENMVESTNANAKSNMHVTWTAPRTAKPGCVYFKAALLQHRNVWFMDDGFLTKKLCPESIDDEYSHPITNNYCCACDEAKYEIVLERIWSRNTHAKDFPSEVWRTRFSEMIGASHSSNYRFWDYGKFASPGVRDFAMHGDSETLESELKANLTGDVENQTIRTIIRAPPILYRNNTIGKSLANVRVDRKHSMISLITKIVPSPDWVLGVAGLDLCDIGCAWKEGMNISLYPWDIGTDSGPSYLSPDEEQKPPDVIRRISSKFPSDHRSPFFRESGESMKPLAILHVRRKKIYDRHCLGGEHVDAECMTTPWGPWGNCSSLCGTGVQESKRAYKDPEIAQAKRCSLNLTTTKECHNTCEEGKAPVATVVKCDLGPWSDWGKCSAKCGNGTQERYRRFSRIEDEQECDQKQYKLKDFRPCEGTDCERDDLDESTSPNLNVQNYCLKRPEPSPKPCNNRPILISNYWFFDNEDKECKIFTTDTCDENKNKFRSLEACEGTCNPAIQSEDIYYVGDANKEPIGDIRNDNDWPTNGFGQPQSQTIPRYSPPRSKGIGNQWNRWNYLRTYSRDHG